VARSTEKGSFMSSEKFLVDEAQKIITRLNEINVNLARGGVRAQFDTHDMQPIGGDRTTIISAEYSKVIK
jgi:hypothetical protein